MGECHFVISVDPYPCSPLTVPKHGAVVCNGWHTRFTTVCAVMCKTGHNLPPGTDAEQLRICTADGRWKPHGKIWDCSEPSGKNRNNDDDDTHYKGSCQSDKSTIGQYYINLLTMKRSRVKTLCSSFPQDCNYNNVTITC